MTFWNLPLWLKCLSFISIFLSLVLTWFCTTGSDKSYHHSLPSAIPDLPSFLVHQYLKCHCIWDNLCWKKKVGLDLILCENSLNLDCNFKILFSISITLLCSVIWEEIHVGTKVSTSMPPVVSEVLPQGSESFGKLSSFIFFYLNLTVFEVVAVKGVWQYQR